MKPPPPRLAAYLRRLRELRAELRELKANPPPPQPHLLQVFADAMKPPKDEDE